MRFVPLTVCLLMSVATPGLAQTAADPAVASGTRLDCLRASVTIADAIADRRTMTFAVHNTLDWPLSGIRIGHRVQSPDRAVPWVNGTAAVPVPGGVEPGETRTVSIGITPIPLQFSVIGLDVEVDLLDVADAQQRLFLASVRVTGWSREPSPNTCG